MRPPPPNPNGYDDFLKAADLLNGDITTAPTLDQTKLRELVATNTAALRLLRVGMTRVCQVPSDFTETNAHIMISDLGKLKRLSRLIAAEARLAELENRPADAARSYIDSIRFGNEVSRGGFLINRLMGIACETMGGAPLARLAPNLSCEQVRPLLTDLEKIDATRMPWQEIFENENTFARRTTRNPINRVALLWMTRAAWKKGEEKHQTSVARLRLLIAELALQCYRSEQGRGPERLDQLVPKLLKAAPVDPFSGKSLIYRPQGTNWLLYSVGTDGVDDGGVPGTTTGDLLLDSSW